MDIYCFYLMKEIPNIIFLPENVAKLALQIFYLKYC